MDPKVLLAMVMIMMVLLLDQVISPRYYRPKSKPKPAPAQSVAGQGTAAAPNAPSQDTTAPSTPAPILSSGAAVTPPVVESAPTETRAIRTEHFAATLPRAGAPLAPWTPPASNDEM